MSIKAVHLLFITLATLLALGFGVWCVQFQPAGNRALYVGLGAVSFAAAAGLVAYGVWFIRKLKREGML
ncbi:MAG: hypothetical protein HZA91_15980 [Verrucomicrobia bacterium]|nr:hypothetical protein [Verrucomicrobiota bacterium]